MFILRKLKNYIIKPKYRCSPVQINGNNGGLITSDMYGLKQLIVYHGYLMLLILCYKEENKLTFSFSYSNNNNFIPSLAPNPYTLQIPFQIIIEYKYIPYKISKVEIDIHDFHIVGNNNAVDHIIQSYDKLYLWIKF
jgi:hypothetical protein